MAGLFNILVDQTLFFIEDLFDMRRMNAAVEDQALQRTASNFAPHRIETGYSDRLGCIVHDDIYPGGLFKSANIAAVAADDAPFHLLIGQRYQRSGHRGHVLRCNALDGIGNQFTRSFFALRAGFGFDLADDAGHIIAGIFFGFLQQHSAGLFGGHFGDPLQFYHLLSVHLFDFVCPPVYLPLTLGQKLVALFDFLQAEIHIGAAFGQAFFFFR